MISQKLQSGFSLVETLVAITILLIVIVGPMTITSSSATSTSFASEQVVAFFLAQEGAELAQKARDDIVLQGFVTGANPAPYATFWEEFSDETAGGMYEDCFSGNGCSLEISELTDGAIESPSACTGTNCVLYYDSSTSDVRSRYTHTSLGNTVTDFTRTIFFTNVNAREVEVISRVEWFNGSVEVSQQVEVETYLFDVYGN